MSYQDYLNENNPRIRMEVRHFGVITAELFPAVAPKTVANFYTWSKKGFITD